MNQQFRNKIVSLFRGGFFHILTGNVLNRAIAMISSIIVARIVDKNAYAYLSYADNLYAYLALFAGLGLPNALLKFCRYNEHQKNRAYFEFAVRFGTCFEIVLGLALCLVVVFVPIPFPEARVFVWALVLYPILTNLQTTFSDFVRTQYENKLYAKASLLQTVLICILNIAFVYLFNAGGIVLSRYAALTVTLIYLGRYIRNTLKDTQECRLEHDEKIAFLKMGLALMVANFFSGVMPLNEAFLVNNIVKDEVITANFKIAGLFPQTLLLISGAVTVYFFPIVSQMSDWAEIRKKVVMVGLANGVGIVFLVILGMLLTPLAIRILYGTKYLDAIPMTYMLWVMRGMNCAIRIVPINFLPAIGKTKFNMWVALISCIVQVVLDYIFIIRWGVSGVALGATIVYFLSGIAYWIYFLNVCNSEMKKEAD